MKLLTFETGGTTRLGALAADNIVIDLTAGGNPALASMQALIEAGSAGLAAAHDVAAGTPHRFDAGAVRWLAPLPVPAQMRDFLVFEQHMRGAGFAAAKIRARWNGTPAPAAPGPIPPIWYEQPIYYKCNRFAVAGPDTMVRWPPASHMIDYELELACVIGRGGRDITAADAPAHIFGYTIFNDLTARDLQFRETQGPLGPAKGKDFDGANVLGPVIVTADELDPAALSMRARINGELWSEGNSATMHWSFAQMIEHVSRSETLHPGEILGSGTVGTGCGLELGRFLRHGDVVELEIAGIGTLTTTIDALHVMERPTL